MYDVPEQSTVVSKEKPEESVNELSSSLQFLWQGRLGPTERSR